MYRFRDLLLIGSIGVIGHGCAQQGVDFVARPGFKPTIRFEIRRASCDAVDGWAVRSLKGKSHTLYISPEVEISNSDIERVSVTVRRDSERSSEEPLVVIRLTKTGSQKLSKLTGDIAERGGTGAKRTSALLVDGEVIVEVRATAQLTGGIFVLPRDFASSAEAESFAKGLIGQ